MTLKMQKLVSSCGECPHYRYYSGGAYLCGLVDQNVIDKEKVVPFCPLPDYPADTIADMEMTILALRKGNELPVATSLMSIVAARLNSRVGSRQAAVEMPCKDERSIVLNPHFIVSMEVSPFQIRFRFGDGSYKLHPESSPPKLYELRSEEGQEERWLEVELSL